MQGDSPWTADLRRRDLLKLGGAALAAGASRPGLAAPSGARPDAQARRHHLRLRLLGPAGHFDPQLTISYKTNDPAVLHPQPPRQGTRRGPAIAPGHVQPLEGDLAESWTQPNDTTYVFKLRKGVRWHNKPPVNGRELTAEDVKYTFDRFVTIKGNANADMLESVDKVEAVDKYTVKFTLKEPYAWFLDMLASTSTWHHRQGGPWRSSATSRSRRAVHRHRPVDARALRAERAPHLRAQPQLLHGRPALRRQGRGDDRRRTTPRASPPSSPASTTSARSTAWSSAGATSTARSSSASRSSRPRTTSWSSAAIICDAARPGAVQGRAGAPGLRMAIDRQEVLETNALVAGRGRLQPRRCPPRSRTGRSRSTSSARARKLYKYDPAEAKKLLAEAGHPNGFKATDRDDATATAPTGWTRCRSSLRNWKDSGHRRQAQAEGVRRLHLEHLLRQVRHDGARAPQAPGPTPTTTSTARTCPGEPLKPRHVNDPDARRDDQAPAPHLRRGQAARDHLRHPAPRSPAGSTTSTARRSARSAAWEPYVKNFAPNLGYDYGGRLMAAWLDR